VGHDHRQGTWVGGADVDEVNAQLVDLGHKPPVIGSQLPVV